MFVSSEGLSLWLVDGNGGLLRLSSHGLRSPSLCLNFLFLVRTAGVRLDATDWTSFYLYFLLKGPVSKDGLILRYWGGVRT